jgi:nucleotide-binding universal stress UspA family protein
MECQTMYQRILIPTDGSATSAKALAAAIELSKYFGARLMLIHAIDDLAYRADYQDFGGYQADLPTLMRESGAKVLAEGVASAKAAGVEADCELFDKFGERLGETVANAARAWKAELIVVGSHGRRGLGRVLLGSGAEQIIREAPVPVLVLRAPGD